MVPSQKDGVVDLGLLKHRLGCRYVRVVVFEPLLIIVNKHRHKDGHEDDTQYCSHCEFEGHQVEQKFFLGDSPDHGSLSTTQILPYAQADLSYIMLYQPCDVN